MLSLLLLTVNINYIICLNDTQEQDTRYFELNKLDVSCSYTQDIANIFFTDASAIAPNMGEPIIRPYHNCECKNPIIIMKNSLFQVIVQVQSGDQRLYLKEHELYNCKITHDISTERYVQKNSFKKQNLKDALVADSSILVSSFKLLNQLASYLILIILFAILHSKHTNKVINLHLLIILFASHCFYDVSADLIDDNFDTNNQGFTINSAPDYIIKNCTFTSCQDVAGGGGALVLQISNGAQVFIINSTFTECFTQSNGGAIRATISSSGTLTISDSSSFVRCHADGNGGGIYAEIDGTNSKLIIREVVIFDNCNAKVGGGIQMRITNEGYFDAQKLYMKECTSQLNGGGLYAAQNKGSIIFDNKCEFVNCSTSGSGGAMYLLLYLSTGIKVNLNDVAIRECQSYNNTSQYALSGLGGGIFINGQGIYDVSSRGLNFKGMKFDRNKAEKHGQSMYVVMSRLKEFCQMGIAGEYVKGNYSDYHSVNMELMGYVLDYADFYVKSQTEIEQNQKYLEDLWDAPYGSIWHVSNRVQASFPGLDQSGCATFDSPCESIQYAIDEISDKRELGRDNYTSEKRIGISESGYDLQTPYNFSPSQIHTNLIKIMKQLYGTPLPSPMQGQAQLMIKKGGSSSTIENGQPGWIQATDGITLRMYEIDIITDQSILTIPVIYVQDSNTLLELNTITFSGINLSPTSATRAQGIVHVNVNNQHLIAQNSVFENINIQGEGGNAIRFENNANSRVTATITNCQFKNINAKADSNGRGGSAIFAQQRNYGLLMINSNCQFIQCINDKGNGGALYIDIDFNSLSEFKINDAFIKDCQATADTTSTPPTGYGGGIFLTGTGDYDVLQGTLDLSGMRIFGNSATKGGQSIYVIMSKLKELCRYGNAGQYVKGNYTDGTSHQNELEGIPIRFDQFLILTTEQFVKQQRPLEYFWTLPQEDIWHLQTGTVQSIESEDQQWCGNIDEPCNTIEYVLEQISVRKGVSQQSIIPIKKIGINEGGFELINPFEFKPDSSYTPIIKLMKQMYGTSSAMNGNAEIKIKKSNDDSKEVGKSGWISALGGIELRIYEIKFITDQSILTIPVIYIQDSTTLLELDKITISGINLSPTSSAKGIVHINVNNQNFIAQNSVFEDIIIEGEGGNAIRFDNNANSRIIATITNCQFKNINAKADSNGRGGSAIFAQQRNYGSLMINSNCQFIQCINDKGNGGALYIDIDFNSLFQFKINDAFIKDCQATADTTSTPPTGYGGGIFLTGTGDYDISSPPKLDFSGMRILGNTANKAGQSLYVVTSELQKWCSQGTLGLYVKGNYSEAQSNIDELEGILIDQSEFVSLTSEDILEQQNHLEYFWSEIVTLTKVDVTINQSDSSIPVSFAVEGTNMLLDQLSVKIIDQGAKTQNNQNELILNILNSSSISSIFQFFTQLQHNKQQIQNRSNAFETIYPPNDGTSTIDIVGEPQNEQQGYFDMHDYSSWFNYDEKEYGVLASNNRRIFTGVDGKERKPVQLSTNIVITIPEPEPETETEVIEEEIVPTKPLAWYKRLPWWVFLLIGIGILLLLLSLLCCCCCFCCGCCCCGKDNSEEKDKENEKLREYNQEQENQQSNQTEMYNIAETDQSKADYSYKKSAAQPQQDEIAKRITKEPYQELSIQQPPINLSADNPFEFKTSQVQPLDQNTQPPRPHSQQGLSSGNPSSSTQYPRRSPGPNSQQRRSPGPNQQHGHSPGPNQQHGNPSSSSQYPRRSPGPNQQNGPRQPHGYKSGPKQQQRGRPPAQKDHSGASPPDQI